MTDHEALSPRELEILRLVATGASNKEIAHKLFISMNTVKVHLRNIFAKIDVASRTEAAMYALREGLVQVPGVSPEALKVENLPVPEQMPPSIPVEVSPGNRLLRYSWTVVPIVILLLGVASFIVMTPQSAPVASASPASPANARWQRRASLPTARSSFAVATYENQIYAIGGETILGVTSEVERYDPANDNWTLLSPKPVPAADVAAGITGGLIFVPGGRLSNGEISNVLEVYDPRQDRWEKKKPLPIPLSAYTLVAFEGHLYLFGGWDGKKYLASTYEYDPGQDTWLTRTPMPTPRGYASAAVVGGKIFVIGGYDGQQILSTNEEYLPVRDNGREAPWTARASLPAGRYAMGIANIADIVHVIGGEGQSNKSLPPVEYFHQQDKWQTFDSPITETWSHLGLVPVERQLYALGGKLSGTLTSHNLAYQAIYTIFVPAPVIP